MEKRQLTCINCPLGCQITVTLENGEVKDVTGNTCPRGDAYARNEVTNPTRVVTSIVKVDGGNLAACSVKTKEVIPKGKIFDILDILHLYLILLSCLYIRQDFYMITHIVLLDDLYRMSLMFHSM